MVKKVDSGSHSMILTLLAPIFCNLVSRSLRNLTPDFLLSETKQKI